MNTEETNPPPVVLSTALLAEYVDEGNWGNYALCARCGKKCSRTSCSSCDCPHDAGRNDEECEYCLDGELWWCDDCGEIEGWLPDGQSAPVVQRGVRPLGEATQVTLTLSDRPQTLTMQWDRARDLFVRCFGIDAIQDCREALERGYGWTGKSAGNPGVTLTVDLAA